jgi:hypothetical protein
MRGRSGRLPPDWGILQCGGVILRDGAEPVIGPRLDAGVKQPGVDERPLWRALPTKARHRAMSKAPEADVPGQFASTALKRSALIGNNTLKTPLNAVRGK